MKNLTQKFILFFLLLSFFSPNTVFAKKTIADANDFLKQAVEPTGVSTEDLNTRVANIIKGALQLVGVAFLVLMVYGGFTWMTARGEDAKIDQAKETISAAIIGLVLIVGAYAITNFVTEKLINKQSDAPGGGSAPTDEPNAPDGCCQFKAIKSPDTWTAFTMKEGACKQSCIAALGSNCNPAEDMKWDITITPAACDLIRQQ
jgi:hypothetical protein